MNEAAKKHCYRSKALKHAGLLSLTFSIRDGIQMLIPRF